MMRVHTKIKMQYHSPSVGHGPCVNTAQRKKKSNVTHSLLMMSLHNKENCMSLTSCLSCNEMTLWGKNTWSLTLYEMSGIKVSRKGKAQRHSPSVGHAMKCDNTSWMRNLLTSCWSWNEMW